MRLILTYLLLPSIVLFHLTLLLHIYLIPSYLTFAYISYSILPYHICLIPSYLTFAYISYSILPYHICLIPSYLTLYIYLIPSHLTIYVLFHLTLPYIYLIPSHLTIYVLFHLTFPYISYSILPFLICLIHLTLPYLITLLPCWSLCHIVHLTLSYLIHPAEASTGPATTNIALNKPTMQQSFGWGGVPNRAVDGNKQSQWSGASCTHTQSVQQAWWAVDLGAVSEVYSVSITNRADCCCKYNHGGILEPYCCIIWVRRGISRVTWGM